MRDNKDIFLDKMEDFVIDSIKNRTNRDFTNRDELIMKLATEFTFSFLLDKDLLDANKLNAEVER